MLQMLAIALVFLISAISCAEARFPRGAPAVPQITYNIVTDGGATCNGDAQAVTRTLSITNGTNILTATASTWASGDVGKSIVIPNAGPGGNTQLITTITQFDSATQIRLGSNAQATLSSVSTLFGWGTDDAVNFKTFNTWAVANQGNNQVVLRIPDGASCWFGSSQSYPTANLANAFTAGINNLIVDGGTGATISSIGGSNMSLGVRGVCQAGLTFAGGCTARIQTVSAGASQVVLTADSFAAGYLSRFSVGKWIMMAGVDVQGGFQIGYGFPPNETYFEWRQITAIDGGTGTLTLDRPLTHGYRSDWPNYNSGTAFEADQAGSATIYAMHDLWNKTVEYRNLTIGATGQFAAGARYATFRNVFFPGSGGNCGVFPSQNETFTAVGSNWDQCIIEMDKLVGLVTMDGVTARQIDWQSNSIERLVMTNSTIQTMFGAARDSEITDTSFTTLFRPGSYNYGNSYKLVCTRCNAATYQAFPQGGIFANPGASGVYSMSGGVISWPANFATIAAQAWSAPINVPVFFSTAGFMSVGSFNVTGISGGAWPASDNQTVTTNVTMANGSKNLQVSTSLFTSGDVGKVIIINNARSGPFPLRTYITAFTDAQNVTVYDACTNALSASSQTVQWGTATVSVQTNRAGGFPDATNLGGGYIRFRSSQAPQFTCDGCLGDPVFTAYNIQNGATPLAPIGTFSARSHASQAAGLLTSHQVSGRLVSLTVDITNPYTGSGAGTLNPTGQFLLNTVKQSDWTQFNFFPSINAKVAGTRVITPSGVTCNGSPGGCSGDTNMTVPEAVWISNGFTPSLTLAGSGGVNPSFSITIQTDQSP